MAQIQMTYAEDDIEIEATKVEKTHHPNTKTSSLVCSKSWYKFNTTSYPMGDSY
jgi:hypothetical protein